MFLYIKFFFLILFLLPFAGYAYTDDPFWPCVQRKIETISVGQMWQGKLREDIPEKYFQDNTVVQFSAELSDILATEETIRKIILGFDKKLQSDKDIENIMSAVFLTTFDNLSYLRGITIRRITSTVKKQRKLRDNIDALLQRIDQLQADHSDDKLLSNLKEEYEWKIRAFTDREELIPYMCERPVEYEKRIYFISRNIFNTISGT